MHLFFYSALILSYFLQIFLEWNSLDYFIGILAILCILISFKGANQLYQVAGSIFLLAGSSLFVYLGKPLAQLPYFMTSTVTLMAIFFVLPFINSIIIVGRYDRTVSKLLKSRAVHLGQLYYRGLFSTFLLSTFLSIATIPLIESVLQKNLKNQDAAIKKLFISRLTLRGYALGLIVSPMEILVAISVDMTRVSYLAFLPWLILFACLIFFIDWMIGWKYRAIALQQHQETVPQEQNGNGKVVRKTAMLLVYLAIFIAFVVAFNQMLELGFLTTVSLIILPYSLLWALSIGRVRQYLAYCIPVWKKRTLGLTSYMYLFLSVGFFTTAFNQTDLIDSIHRPVAAISQSPVFLFITIQVLFIALAMAGFHPLVTMSLLSGIVTPLLTSLHPMSIAMVLVTSSLSTVMAGPFNISVSLAGSLLHVNPYRVSLWNIGFAFLFSSIGTLFALFMM